MNADNIKLLIEAFQGMGADAKEAFMVWVLADNIGHLLSLLITAIGLLLIVRTIIRDVCSVQEDRRTLHDAAEVLGVHIYGGHHANLSSAERLKIVYRAQELMAAREAKEEATDGNV